MNRALLNTVGVAVAFIVVFMIAVWLILRLLIDFIFQTGEFSGKPGMSWQSMGRYSGFI